jgi:putative ABC transport system permease protein
MVSLVSSALGAALGVAAQSTLARALRDFLPVAAVVSVAPRGIAAGLVVGLGTALMFALIPLLPLRKVAPLAALRGVFDSDRPAQDRLVWVTGALIVAGVFIFAVATMGNKIHGLWFTVGVVAVFGLLVLLSRLGIALLRKLAPRTLSFPWRQGLANLHRPDNQTTAVTLAIGLGTFLLVTLYGVQDMLVNQVMQRTGRDEPNLVLFDIQKDQRRGIADLIKTHEISPRGEVPVVTMRLTSVKGRRVEELRADADKSIPAWALRREYRSTYRADLTGTERIIQGAWQGKISEETRPIPISLEKGIAETLKVGLGDELQFEIQGVPLPTRVASIREVDWQRVQPNFFVVFPEGVLESAPQFYAAVARTDSNQSAADLQRAIVERFANVSVIDLSLILNALNGILSRVSAAMRFVGLFTIVTGLAVLASAVLGTRSQRVSESILLRTLGAPRKQILNAIVAEYLFLGGIAGVAGAILGTGASWGLAYYFFGTWAAISFTPIVLILLAVIGATVLAGAIGCMGIFRKSPLVAMRDEALT